MNVRCPNCRRVVPIQVEVGAQVAFCPKCRGPFRPSDLEPEWKAECPGQVETSGAEGDEDDPLGLAFATSTATPRTKLPRVNVASRRITSASSGGQSLGVIGFVFALAAGGAWAWWFLGGGFETHIHKKAGEELSHIKGEVAKDFVRQYEIAKRSGTAIDAYVHAGMAAAAFLQAEDEENYRHWKAIERVEGMRAGIPQE